MNEKKITYKTEILTDDGYIDNDGYTSFKIRVVGACPIYVNGFIIHNEDGIVDFLNPSNLKVDTRLQIRFMYLHSVNKEVHIIKTYYV